MKKRTRSTEKETPSATPITTPPSQTDMTLKTWYRDIYSLPLRNFEECLLNKNLSALIISGFPTPEELNKAWESIVTEYSDSLGSVEYDLFGHLFKEVKNLEIDYACVQTCIGTLRKIYSAYFCSELNMLLHINSKLDTLVDKEGNVKDVATYLAILDKCERRSKAMKIRLDLKTIEFDAVKDKMSGEGKEIDKNYFTSMLIILSKHNGYRITKEITVSEYCEYMKQFNLYCEQMRDQIKKK